MLKKHLILGDKWFSPETDQEKALFIEVKNKRKKKEAKEA